MSTEVYIQRARNSQSSCAIPSLRRTVAEMGGRKGGAADQRDQRQLHVRFKTKLLQ